MAFVGELATGVASSLVFEAIRRPFHFLTSEIRRRDKVSKALTEGEVTANPSSLTAALNDLSRIIANAHGALDNNVAEFIQELRKTAIPEAVANAVLCGAHPDVLFPPFDDFYARFKGIPFSARQFFNALIVACTERIDDVSDKAMLEIIRAQHRQITSQVEQISRSLAQQNAAGQITIDQLKDARLKLARAIEATNRYTIVESLQGPKRLRLGSLAIASRLTSLSPGDIASAKIPDANPSMSYLVFRRQFKRAVILGDPGGGKSTLTQMLCNDLARLVALEDSHPGRKDFDPTDLKLPLRIILRSFEAKITSDPSYTLFDYLADEAKLPLDNDEKLTRKFLQNILATGEAMIIFDGLDEVLEIGKRTLIISLIEQFSEIFAACQILITSRLVGYRDAALSEDFENFALTRFSLEDISKYCSKSIKAISGVNKKEAERQAAEFIKQTSKVGGDLRHNPLMLGLMVQIFVYRGDVPSNRPEVYRECATLMFEKWDGRRDIVVEDVPKNDVELLDVFGYVAHKTFGDASSEEGVSREWLTRELREHFEGWYIDKASANRAAKSLVVFLTGRAWVMSEVGSGIFKFTHRTFLEYFFARYLISESRGIAELLKEELIPHVLQNQWIVISHLALHMAIFRDGGKSRQAADVVAQLLADDTVFPAAQELRLLEFVAAALEYLVIPEALYLNIATRLVKRAIYLGAREELAASSIIWTIFQTAGGRLALAKNAAAETFNEHLGGDASPDMLFCMYVLGSKQRDSIVEAHGPFHSRPTRRPNGVLWSSLEDLRLAHKNNLQELAKSNLAVAKAYIFAYGEMRFELYQLHGQNLLEPTLSPLVPAGVDRLFSTTLEVASSSTYLSAANVTGEIADCQRLVSAVAGDFLSTKVSKLSSASISSTRALAIEDDIELAVRHLWISRHRRRSEKSKLLMAEALSGIFLVASSLFDEAEFQRTSRRRSGFMFAPAGVLQDLVSMSEGTALSERLNQWFREREALVNSPTTRVPSSRLGARPRLLKK